MLGHGRSLNLVWLRFESVVGDGVKRAAYQPALAFAGVADWALRSGAEPALGAAAVSEAGAVAGTLAAGFVGAGAVACFCCAAFSFSHAWNSSFERASTTIGMKPWSRPHNSAH